MADLQGHRSRDDVVHPAAMMEKARRWIGGGLEQEVVAVRFLLADKLGHSAEISGSGP